ncbi:MAG: cupin domain-containing protein [Burkholderiales bacterium]|nr:cupin domain-containing protein [Burkholderiales bacterium]
MEIETGRLLSIVASLVAAAGITTPSAAFAADAPLSYKASPQVYKLLGENDQFRVILQTSKPGQRDDWHSHSALATYRLADCTSRLHLPDGKYRDSSRKSGEVAFLPAVSSHSFENTGKTDCVALIVERK